ncbi:MAG TPA: peptidylprolyl isomerase [Ignavibacteriales bacterium]|nr:peptidylprolyl isomerase [Ignavibacteriales bacterium]
MKKLLLVVFLSVVAFAQKPVDKIIAIVGTEIITKSEVELQSLIYAYQKGLNPQDPKIRQFILNQLIEDKLIYNQAQLDSIVVTDDEVNKQVEFQLQNFIKQAGSKERLEQIYKMSYEKIKKELKYSVKKNLMSQKVQEKRFANREISRREVEEFYNTYKDSLPIVPTKYKLSHIFVLPKIDNDTKINTYRFANKILDSILMGASFEEMAKKYSDHKESAIHGGNLGYIARGGLLPEFEAAAFALENGKISKVVETPLGYHIIKLIDKKGDKINVSQILFKFKSQNNVDSLSVKFLTSIRDSILSGENTFEFYATKYSEDKESNKFGGDIGLFDKNQLEGDLYQIVSVMKIGEISRPRRLNLSGDKYGYHIVKLTNVIPEHFPNLNTDFDEIKQLAEYRIRQDMYNKWIEELKSKIFFEIKE